MSAYFLSIRPVDLPPTLPADGGPLLEIVLESLDRTKRIPLDGSRGWTLQPGATGLEMPPFDVATSPLPGAAGSMLRDVRTEERPVFLPIFADTATGDHVAFLEHLDRLRDLVDPLTGEFRIVGATDRGERELTVVYTGGLEGSAGRDDRGQFWSRFGLTATAVNPWAYDRSDRTLEFQVAAADTPFLGVVGGTDAPWPGVLGASSVIGDSMRIQVGSEVPVYPVLELVGPMESFTGTMTLEEGEVPPFYGSGTWSVSIPAGVPAGSTLRMVTDPRARSIRLNGALAAGRVARGSTLRPLYPGGNLLSVIAPGGDEDTRIRLSWREAHRSLW